MNRLDDPRMEHYKSIFKNSEMWLGKTELKDKKVIVYFEQGVGDCIQFIRYLKKLKDHGCYIIASCHKSMHSLLEYIDGVDEHIDKLSTEIPEHDYHILAMDLPFLLLSDKCVFPLDIEQWWLGESLEGYMEIINEEIPKPPYINFLETTDLEKEGINVGIAWEGNTGHENNKLRSCPLRHFSVLETNLFCLQDKIYSAELSSDCEEMELYGVEINDFKDTARLINSVDLVISVDTAVLHLAGALGKKGYGIFSNDYSDNRWNLEEPKSLWYPTLELIKDKWENLFKTLVEKIETI